MMNFNQVLSKAEVEQFVEEGYVVVRGATPRPVAQIIQERVLKMMPGIDPNDPATWKQPVIGLKESIDDAQSAAAFTPRLVGAMEDLMGKGRWDLATRLGWFPTSFPGHVAGPWKAPVDGWHVDGGWFHHHVNSKEQGLLPIHLLTDIDPGGGGTAILPGSHMFVARLLAQSEPEGLSPAQLVPPIEPYVIENLDRVIEMTGQMGDVVLTHPFMVHAQSPNTGRRIRIIANPAQSYREPMNLNPADASNFSPVERAIVMGLNQMAAAKK
ncbi:MAG TPA: phytanoyl-CoA dioxygenase family protein [Tepidisphaeraceae bacterium]|jgi:hypothetical protein